MSDTNLNSTHQSKIKNLIKESFNAQLRKNPACSEDFRECMPDCRIGWVFIDWDEHLNLLPIQIQRPSQEVPKSVGDAFERHLWYSRYNISDICLLSPSLENKNIYVLLMAGHVHDAWDNGCALIEIFDEEGDFVDSGDFDSTWKEGILQVYIAWKGRQLNGGDYYFTAPPWPENPPPPKSSELYNYCAVNIVWSEV